MRIITTIFITIGVFVLLGFVAYTDDVPKKAQDISPLLIGETIPEVKVTTLKGKKVLLNELIAEKPSILVFYRGGWCPYCRKQLSGLQTAEKAILDMGYQVIAVSPDKPEKLNKTLDKVSLKYTLVSDNTMEVSKQFGIAYEVNAKTQAKLKDYGIDLSEFSGEKHALLPVPTVMILDKKGKIKFEYINPNYTERLDSELLLVAAKMALKEEK